MSLESKEGVVTYSMFNGMNCGRIALERAGIPVKMYLSAEIDKPAIQITQKNYPDTIQLGDVCGVVAKDLPKVDLLLAGSPCQGFSFAGKRLAFDDPRSMLFFEFIRMLKELKPKYFLLENVRMKKEYLDIITEQVSSCYTPDEVDDEFVDMFGNVRIEPILINSALVSAQNRLRYYWTNIPNVQQPEDRGIVLRDILEDNHDENPVKDTERNRRHYKNPDDKSLCMTATMYKGAGNNGMTLVPMTKPDHVGTAVDIKGYDIIKRVYSPDGKSPTLTTMQGGHREPKVVTGAWRGRYNEDGSTTQKLELRKDDKTNTLTTVQKDNVVVDQEMRWRKLTPLECERLQTVPDNYTEGVSNTQRYKMLGNGWTIDVISHILSNIK
jgi:DNA (cytosine-5)-methyltransferase 3A